MATILKYKILTFVQARYLFLNFTPQHYVWIINWIYAQRVVNAMFI